MRDLNHSTQIGACSISALIIIFQAVLSLNLLASAPESIRPLLEQISHAALFYQPLAPLGETPPTEAENRSLWAEVQKIRERRAEPDLDGLEQFLRDHPDSPWAASVHANLGCLDYEHGLYTRALSHWESAWAKTHFETAGAGKAVADFTFAHWTRLLASLGRVQTLRDLFRETQGRVFDHGPLQQMVNSTREGYQMMMTEPGDCFKCGTYALINLGRQIKGATFPFGSIEGVPSPTNGFSMARVVELSSGAGLELVPARWGEQKVPVVPSIIHWKQDHYAALLEQKGTFYLVVDPTFGHRRWIRQSTIAEEATGEFIVPRERVPADWQTLTMAEAGRIFGRGNPSRINNGDDSACNGSGGGDPAGTQSASPGVSSDSSGGCASCSSGSRDGGDCCKTNVAQGGGGMPSWSVSEPYVSLWLRDRPVGGYQPGLGYPISPVISYNQRETRPALTNIFGFGKLWNCSWLAYVVDNPDGSDSPALNATLYKPGGGQSTYFPATVDFLSNTMLERNPSSGDNLTNYVLHYADGAYDVYGFVPRTVMIGTHPIAFLTAEIDPYGHTNLFQYQEINDSVQLLYVVDADGRTNSLTYTRTNVVGSITDPFGRQAFFDYDSNEMLSSITDALGLPSTIHYDERGWVTNLITPYGTTAFEHYTNATCSSEFGGAPDCDTNYNPFLPVRAIRIVDPAYGTNIYMLKQDSSLVFTNPDDYFSNYSNGIPFLPVIYTDPSVVPVVPTSTLDTNSSGSLAANLYFRDSFHWGPLQASGLPANILTFAPSDYRKARMRHWLHNGSGESLGISQILDIEQAPSPDGGATPGQTTWFDYDGKPSDARFVGTQSLPSLIARVLPDGTSGYTWYQRDMWGRATNVTETYSTSYGQPPETRTTSYIYGGTDLIKIIGPVGETLASYIYDPFHQLTNFTDAAGAPTSWTYDTNGLLTSIKGPTGLTTTNIYFASGPYTNWVQQRIDLEISRTNSFTYTNDLLYTRTDERGLTTTFGYDDLQRPTFASDSRGAIYFYYNKLDLSQVTDRMGFGIWFGYDQERRLRAVTNALGYYTLYNYCPCGALESVQDKLGNLTQFFYDSSGRLTNTVYTDFYGVTNQFDLLGRLVYQTDSAGISIARWFNNQGLLYAITNSAGNVGTTTFDIEDRGTNHVDGNGVTTVMTYDDLGRLLSRSYPDTGVENFGHSPAGLIAYTNQIGAITRYVYDAAGRRTFETNANLEVLQYGYSAAGDLLTLTDGKTQTVTFHWDQYGRMTNKLDQLGTEILRLTYDLDNRATNRWTAAKGNTAYTFDHVGNLTVINYPTSPDVNFTYDPMNRLTNMVDGVGTTVFAYTSAGQLLSEDGPFASDTVTNGYSNGFRTGLGLQQPTGEWTNGFSYDGAGRFHTIISPAGTFTYYRVAGAQGLISGISLPNLSFITNLFDENARLTTNYLETSVFTILDSATYGYNQANQRTNFTDTTGASVQYSYDHIGQLTVAASSVTAESRGYTYDHAWNLNWLTNNGSAHSFLPDSKNELTNAYSATYSYDANGNPTSGTNSHTSYVYDDENRLIQWFWYAAGSGICSNGALRTDFVYDGLGRLRKRTEYSVPVVIGGGGGGGGHPPPSGGGGGGGGCSWGTGTETRYTYDGSRVIEERNGSNSPLVAYTRGPDLSGSLEGAGGVGGLLARSDGYSTGNFTSHNYYHADGNGNITFLVNSSQTRAAAYRYDAFGNTITAAGTLAAANVYRFSSKECHTNSGMYCFLYRFYDPNLQRWLNRDPLGEAGGINLYGFVDNDPVGEIDPLGLAGTPEELDREIEREDVAELRESMGRDASGRYRSDRELVRLAEEIEQNTKRDREKFEENPPYRGSEPIMRPLVPKGRPQTGNQRPTPTPSRVCQDAKKEPITDPARLLPAPRTIPRDPFHHVFPRRADLASQFRLRGINPDDFTLQVPKPIHQDIHSGGPRGGDWNRAWEDFFSANPNATALEVYIQAGNMMHQFQVPGGPVVPYPR